MTTKRKLKAKRKTTKPRRLREEWSALDERRADKEGWGVFDVYGGLQEIQRDDARNRFKSDETLMEHVYRRALAGSRLHVRALVVHCRQAIDVFKAAYGYEEDDQIPEKRERFGGSGNPRYSHQFRVAYSVNSDHPTGEDLTAWAHREAIMARALELTELSADEATQEAVENMDNTIENECLSAGGWPPEPEESENPATTG